MRIYLITKIEESNHFVWNFVHKALAVCSENEEADIKVLIN